MFFLNYKMVVTFIIDAAQRNITLDGRYYK